MIAQSQMVKVITRTALHAVPTALGIVILSFFLLRLAPGDAVDVLAGEAGSSTAEGMAQMRSQMGLDQSVYAQLLSYLNNLAHGSLGWSVRYNMPVMQMIGDRLPGTLILTASALAIALVLGIALGVTMAAFEGKLPDRLLSIISLVFYSLPAFWIGLMLIVLFSIKLGWLPSGGSGTIGTSATGIALLLDKARYMILPATSLALFYVAIYARLTRVSMIDVKAQDYVRTARAKGLSGRTVILRHILRNALLPVTTVAGMHVGGMLGGAVVIETVYGWPGLGRLAYESVMGRDFAVLLGILLFSSLLVIAANAAVDLLHGFLDPRVGSA
ncbi:MAG: Binding-protein-dependent transport system inner rane component [Sphingomonadales bacterium]|nr:Binding-protein-dependent transport system inner rane component [Sphingomonadales bacterium]